VDECKPLVPGAEGVSADHQCIAWCNQLVRAAVEALVVRCRLTVSQPVLKPPMVGALETIIICKLLSTFAFSFNLRRYTLLDVAEAAAATEHEHNNGGIILDAAARRNVMAARLLPPLKNPPEVGSASGSGGGGWSKRVFGHDVTMAAARLALEWTPSVVPAMAAHAAVVLILVLATSATAGGAAAAAAASGGEWSRAQEIMLAMLSTATTIH
jgi:hypothetical protein